MAEKHPRRPRASPTAARAAAPAPEVRYLEVSEHQVGQRLDNFLIARLKGVPKTRIYRMIRTGEVRVNKSRATAEHRIEEGDVIRIPPVRVAEPAHAQDASRDFKASRVADSIGVIAQDEAILAIDKPAGLAVHGGSGVSLGVIEALRLSAKTTGRTSRAPVYLELVHRLDRETSGVLLLAKKRSALLDFHRQLREGRMRKRYLALVWGAWPRTLSRIDSPLHKWVNARGERWVRPQEDGQQAITQVKCLAQCDHAVLGTISLLQCEPITGRTHQLRVHLLHSGHPILGDPKYGIEEKNRVLKKSGFASMYLHAWQLRCAHPVTHEIIHLRADPNADWATLLLALGMGGAVGKPVSAA